jgi:hypothetical protein
MSTLYTVFGDLMEVLCTLYLVLEYFIRCIRPASYNKSFGVTTLAIASGYNLMKFVKETDLSPHLHS